MGQGGLGQLSGNGIRFVWYTGGAEREGVCEAQDVWIHKKGQDRMKPELPYVDMVAQLSRGNPVKEPLIPIMASRSMLPLFTGSGGVLRNVIGGRLKRSAIEADQPMLVREGARRRSEAREV